MEMEENTIQLNLHLLELQKQSHKKDEELASLECTLNQIKHQNQKLKNMIHLV